LGVLLGGQPLTNDKYLQQLDPKALKVSPNNSKAQDNAQGDDDESSHFRKQMPYPGVLRLLSQDKALEYYSTLSKKYKSSVQLPVSKRLENLLASSLLSQFEFWATFLCFGLFQVSTYHLTSNHHILDLKNRYKLPLHSTEISYQLMAQKRQLWDVEKAKQKAEIDKLGPLINRLPPWMDKDKVMKQSYQNKLMSYEMKPEIKNFPTAQQKEQIQAERRTLVQNLDQQSVIPKSMNELYQHSTLSLLHYPRKNIQHSEVYSYASNTFSSMIYLHCIFEAFGITGLLSNDDSNADSSPGKSVVFNPIPSQYQLTFDTKTNPLSQLTSADVTKLTTRIEQVGKIYAPEQSTAELQLPYPTTLPQAILNMLVGYSYQLPPLAAPHFVDAVNPILAPQVLLDSKTNKMALKLAARSKLKAQTSLNSYDAELITKLNQKDDNKFDLTKEKQLRWSYELFCAKWVLWAPVLYERMIIHQCKLLMAFEKHFNAAALISPTKLDIQDELQKYTKAFFPSMKQIIVNQWPNQGNNYNFIHESFIHCYFNRREADKPILNQNEMNLGLDKLAERYFTLLDHYTTTAPYEVILANAGFNLLTFFGQQPLYDENGNRIEDVDGSIQQHSDDGQLGYVESDETPMPTIFSFADIFQSLEDSPRLTSISIPRTVFVGATRGHSLYARDMDEYKARTIGGSSSKEAASPPPVRPVFKSDAVALSWPYHYSTLFSKPSLDDFLITLTGYSIPDPHSPTGELIDLIYPSTKWTTIDTEPIPAYTQTYPMYESRDFSIDFSRTTRQIETFIQSILHRHDGQILMMLWRTLVDPELYIPKLKHKVKHCINFNQTYTCELTIMDFFTIAGTQLYAPDIVQTVKQFLDEHKE
jgi:hypothetical protein